MPYLGPRVNENRRRRLEADTLTPAANTAELNFQLTRFANAYLEHHGVSYRTINDVVGALECAKRELQRRVADPYEQRKLEENGDVYAAEVLAQVRGRGE